MEIKGPGRVDSATVRRIGKSPAQPGSSFSVTDTEQPRAQTVTGPGTIAAVDSILMLQGIDDSTSGRSKGLDHGEQLLDMLDQVRDGLLAGGIPRATLNRLASALGRRQDAFVDPKLQNVLDEIELRARVELAKLEMSDRLAS
ncbi:MAG TPA: flagellar assembly protein FliX [Rhizomicrobium sp.]|nr:flagellar assembly protein FliX [Rhizomicrobium sp.]